MSAQSDDPSPGLSEAQQQRRRLCGWPLAAALAGPAAAPFAGPALAQYATPPSSTAANPGATPVPPRTVVPDGKRFALLIGNKVYPKPFDLPPIHKNVRDLGEALKERGFDVTEVLDVDVAQARQAMDAFAKRMQAVPPDAVVFFYFSGHGLQVDAENLLVSANVNITAKSEELMKSSMVLSGDVVGRLPKRSTGLTIAVVDACRTDIRAAVLANDGLNQVEAPPGCMIVFSTGAGKPAIAPAVETQNTFYTASLVKLLRTSADEISFSDLFRLTKLDVQRTMQNHPVAAIRQLAQSPFIAENIQVVVPLAPPPPPPPPAPLGAPTPATPPAAAQRNPEEEAAWKAVLGSLWPPEIVALAEKYLGSYPDSKLAGSAEVARQGAAEAAALLQRRDIRLYRSSFAPRPEFGEGYEADLRKAARGDKDAAARVGRRWRTDASGGAELSRYEGWMQYAAELGNGIASYELALHYRRTDQPQPAARWESRARELGYTPPPSLDNTRK